MTTERSTRRRTRLLGALVGGLGFVGLGLHAPAAALAATAPPYWTTFSTSSATSPPPRQGAAMAYDGATAQIVLFGGLSGNGNLLNDTWLWNGSAWTHAQPPASPPAAEGAAMAYDATLHQLILFGGETRLGSPGSPATVSNQTWAWNGESWFPISSSNPPPASTGATLSGDDRGSGEFVLFGGTAIDSSGTSSTLADTWTFDGVQWTSLAPASSPPARTGAAATWDPVRSQVVLFGGEADPSGSQATTWLGDTWTWDGTTWTPATPATSPTARGDTTLCYDGDLGGDVLVSGQATSGLLSDSWLFDGSSWVALNATAPPVPRSRATASWDSLTHQLLLFGGAAGGGTVYGDTSTLTVAPSSPSRSTTSTTVAPPHLPPTSGSTASSTRPSPTATTVPTSRPTTGTTTPATTASSPTTTRRSAAPLLATADTAHEGQRVTLEGSGFAPGAAVIVSFHSAPVVLGSARADNRGRFSIAVTIPYVAQQGAHHFEASGMGSSGKMVTVATPIRVIASSAPRSNGPTTETLVMVALALLIPVLTWLVLHLLSRRGRRPAPLTSIIRQ